LLPLANAAGSVAVIRGVMLFASCAQAWIRNSDGPAAGLQHERIPNKVKTTNAPRLM
jgi:uncharacterized protein YqhQ